MKGEIINEFAGIKSNAAQNAITNALITCIVGHFLNKFTLFYQ
jgi:hypothetical protein